MKTNFALALVGAALIALPAAAQTNQPAATPPANNTAKPAQTTTAASPMYEMKAGQWRATKLAGVAVYNNNNERIGDVNELIVARDGKVEAVVIGVGGFLGIGEHLAAVPFNQVRWVDEPREQAVGARTTAPATGTTTPRDTTGTGTTTPPAGTTTTAPPPAAGNAATGTTERPATAMDRPATDRPATTTTTTRTAAADAYRGYPDHAIVDMTKEQLKALPQVRYAR